MVASKVDQQIKEIIEEFFDQKPELVESDTEEEQPPKIPKPPEFFITASDDDDEEEEPHSSPGSVKNEPTQPVKTPFFG